MSEFRIVWVIDLEADSHLEAAMKAQEAQRDPASLATVFTVLERDGKGMEIDLDLCLRH